MHRKLYVKGVFPFRLRVALRGERNRNTETLSASLYLSPRNATRSRKGNRPSFNALMVVDGGMCSESGRSGIGELRKPVSYSVTDQSFPGLPSTTSSPAHHLDLREVPPPPPSSKIYLPPYHHQLLCRPPTMTVSSSPGGGSLRSAGRVRFLHDVGGLPAELCDPSSSEELACLAGSTSLTGPPSSSVLPRVRCLRGQPAPAVPGHHCHDVQSSSIDDLLPPPICSSVVCSHSVVVGSPQMTTSLMSKYSHN